MGTFHEYQCPLCEYRIDRMASGYQMGEQSHVAGICCGDCEALYVLPLAGTPREVRAALNRERGEADAPKLWGDELMAEMGRVAIAHSPLRCPASDEHAVQPWSAPGPCPRCGETLEQGGSVMEWD